MINFSERDTLGHEVTALHEAAYDLQTSTTEEEICRKTVAAAEEILAFDNCIVALQQGDHLPLYAQSSQISSDKVVPSMSVNEGIAGLTYRTQKSYLIDDISTVEEANPQGPYESAISVPIGEKGIFQAVSTISDFFSDNDLELAELLVSHTANALDRVANKRELEQYAGFVSHDLRNPLSVANGYLELAQDECDSSHLVQVEDALKRMNTLIEELLVLAQQNETQLTPKPINFETIIETSWDNVETGGATLTIDVDGLSIIEADQSHLQQLLENLFRNAIEHAGPDVTVRIGLRNDGFYVEDDGPGIPTGQHHQIFKYGYSTHENGTGFGLKIVERIAQLHGWKLSLTDGVDGGARFEFVIADSGST